MTEQEAILRLRDHFAIHDDGRPTPFLNKAVSMAINALEKQIAKKSNKIERKRDEYGFIYQLGECPLCGKVVSDDRQCCDCGQRLNWEE